MSRFMHWSRCALALATCSVFIFQVSHALAAGRGRPAAPQRVAKAPQRIAQAPKEHTVFADDMAPPHNGAPQPYQTPGGEYYGNEYEGGNCNGGDCYGGDCGDGGCYGGDCGDGGCYGGDCCGVGCSGDCCGCGDCGCSDCWYGGCCGTCDGCGCCGMQAGYYQPKIAVWAESLYLQATDGNVTHAQQGDGIGGAGTAPFGEVGSVDMGYEGGSRIGASIGCSDCARILFSWTYYESEAFASLQPPTIPGGGGTIRSLVHYPDARITSSTGPVDAFQEIDFQMADVAYHRIVRCGNNYYLGFLAGAQYGHLEQRFAQEGNFGSAQVGRLDTATEIEFDGGGLKAGIDGESVLGGGFTAYGRMVGAAMSGRFHSRYLMDNPDTTQIWAFADWTDDRIVPNLEYELGLAWTSCGGCLRLSTGYMFSHWMNVVTTPEFIQAVQQNNYVDVGDTLSFDGIVSRVELRW